LNPVGIAARIHRAVSSCTVSTTGPRVTARQVLVAIGLSAALIVVWLAVLPHAISSGGDTVFYLRLALEPKAPAETPYAFRVLTPFLAHQLGGNHYPEYDTSFRIIAALALVATGPATYMITRRLGGTGPRWSVWPGCCRCPAGCSTCTSPT
jgi:hypothetical protein